VATLVSIRGIPLGLPLNSLKKQAIQINILEIITLPLATGETAVVVTNKKKFMIKSGNT
jgi:hypothetical protein